MSHMTSQHLKRSASFGFEGGTLNLHISGFGTEDGSGCFILDEGDVIWLPHDEREGHYLEVKVPQSEMVELRNWLVKWVTGSEPPLKYHVTAYPDNHEPVHLIGTGYATRCAAHIVHENIPDALWALEVLNKYGHLVPHPADRLGEPT